MITDSSSSSFIPSLPPYLPSSLSPFLHFFPAFLFFFRRDAMFAFLCLRLSVCLLLICLSVCVSAYLSVCLSVCLFTYLPICLSVYLCLSIFLCVCLFVSFSLCLFICLLIYLPVCLFLSVCLNVFFFLIDPVPV